MGILDRFRTSKQPAKTPRGESGRGHTDGYLQLEELNADLTGERGLQVFDRMYWTDPDVRKNLWMIINLVLSATFTVEPYGQEDATPKDEEAAQAVEWAIFENMRGGLEGHFSEALPVGLRSGFAPFEEVWEVTKWKGRDVIAPKKLDLRLPRTITRWNQKDGELVEIEQQLTRGEVMLPAEDLIYYRVGAEGDNWEGRSLLRPAYKPWYLKEQIEKLDAIKQERQAVGVPVCYPPRQATDEQLEEMISILANLRSGEQAFVLMPGPKAETMNDEVAQEYGWSLGILGTDQSKTSDTKPSMEYHSDKIAAALMTEFMRLGQGGSPGGSRAVGDVQQNPFQQAVEALSKIFLAPLNDALIARFVALNFEVEGPPKLVMSLVDETTLNDLADYVAGLVEKEVLHPDDDLEDFLRKRGKLPPVDVDERKARKEAVEAGRKAALENPQVPPGKGMDPNKPDPKPPVKPTVPEPPEKKPVPKTEADDVPVPEPPRWGRELREWETYMSLEVIDTAITQARDRFQAAAGDTARALAREYATAAVSGKKQPKLGPDLAERIYSELQLLYRTGRSTVVDEIDRQRPSNIPGGTSMIEDAGAEALRRLKRRAELAAESISGRIWQACSRAVLQLNDSGTPEAQAAGELEAAAALKAEAQIHSSAALNEGRSDQADAQADEIEGTRYTSILDKNRCEACRVADDDVLRPLNDPVRLARKPPNPGCYGGDRCRCMEAFQFDDEEPGSGGEPAIPAQVEPGGPAQTHFNVSGGSDELKELVKQQMDAIDQVHRFPDIIPGNIPVRIENRGEGRYGAITAKYDRINRTWEWAKISLDRGALSGDPPITSTVHEIGHLLDQWGFGDGPPHAAIVGNPSGYLSSTSSMREWREAVNQSRSYRNLVMAGADEGYTLSSSELLARSYEQWIAEVSQDPVLLAKIAKRREDNANLYWDSADFHLIAVAFDRFFRTRGLR